VGSAELLDTGRIKALEGLLVTNAADAHTEGPSSPARAVELELRGVSKRYPGQQAPAIEELSFKVPAGEVCVLVGPSGSGKTTAMRLINRMIALTGGDILLGGRSVLEGDPRELRREIGYVIQQTGLFPHRTIEENIATVPQLLGWPKARIAARVAELWDLIGMRKDELAGRYPAQLSGGQRQRVGVARALAADPPLMLMDEPFGAIDPINRARLQDEFLRLQQRVRKTVVFVTHDIDEAIKMGDRIAILREGGRLAQYDTPAEILRSPADDFVAQFVGADRGIKRLSLISVGELKLLAPDVRPAPDGAAPTSTTSVPVVAPAMPARDALSLLLTSRAPHLRVEDEHGTVLGLVTVDLLHRRLTEDAPGDHESGDRAGACGEATATADPGAGATTPSAGDASEHRRAGSGA
jgi:osmoprotectant transport system ATP-binding protein